MNGTISRFVESKALYFVVAGAGVAISCWVGSDSLEVALRHDA